MEFPLNGQMANARTETEEEERIHWQRSGTIHSQASQLHHYFMNGNLVAENGKDVNGGSPHEGSGQQTGGRGGGQGDQRGFQLEIPLEFIHSSNVSPSSLSFRPQFPFTVHHQQYSNRPSPPPPLQPQLQPLQPLTSASSLESTASSSGSSSTSSFGSSGVGGGAQQDSCVFISYNSQDCLYERRRGGGGERGRGGEREEEEEETRTRGRRHAIGTGERGGGRTTITSPFVTTTPQQYSQLKTCHYATATVRRPHLNNSNRNCATSQNHHNGYNNPAAAAVSAALCLTQHPLSRVLPSQHLAFGISPLLTTSGLPGGSPQYFMSQARPGHQQQQQQQRSANMGGHTVAAHQHTHHHFNNNHHQHGGDSMAHHSRTADNSAPNGDLTEEELSLLGDIRRRKAALLMEIQGLKDEITTITNEMARLESSGAPGTENTTTNSLSNKQAQRNKQLSIGRKRFNLDPKKGIEYLQQHGLLNNTSSDVANFLFKGEGLNKTAIGEYLGEKNDFNEEVLSEFVELHDFTNLILVQALRQFLWSFRLPGEAQKIDRMMEKFAQRYCVQNPGVFQHPDVCYILSFSVIMLNTSLHNPAVRDKPSLETFINMNRGINNKSDLPRELLASLYDSIKHEPFKIPEDDGNDLMDTFFNPDREGWLWKQGGRYKNWKRRWFIIKDKCLYYFEYTTDKEPRGIIPLENVRVRDIPDSKSSKIHSFELVSSLGPNEVIKACKTDTDGKVIEGKHTVYRMSAATLEEKIDWIKCIQRSISHSPFYDMLAARKKKVQDA